MQIQFNLLLLLFTCSLVLLLSVYPGVLNNFIVLIVVTLLGLFLMSRLAIAPITLWLKRKEPSTKAELRQFIAALLILAVSYGLLKFYIPLRIGFSLSRPAFEQWLAQHPAKTKKTTSMNEKFGLYQVDQYATGDKGGSYFRVYQHGDGLGPDTVSYGFAYQPNSEESPFGSAYYTIHPLGNQWYWFQSSNDW